LPDPHEDALYGYTVALDAFSGPLDLLLYLIRQQEVDIVDIPIAAITEQYLAHIEMLHEVNVNLAGDFLLMAATLMEIKSRMLLPRHEEEEEDEEDPRNDLIRQLMEYKRFKDAARQLEGRVEAQRHKFVRGRGAALGLRKPDPDEDTPLDLGDVSVWDLMNAFRVILQQTSFDDVRHIVLDQKPASDYCNDLLATLRSRPNVLFQDLFNPADGRTAVINAFLALLELLRRRRVRIEQQEATGPLRILLVDDRDVTEDELLVEERRHTDPDDLIRPRRHKSLLARLLRRPNTHTPRPVAVILRPLSR